MVRLTPGAGADRIGGLARASDGSPVLRVSVTSPPQENRANKALIALLAKEWHLPKRDVAIIAGAKSRNKTVLIAGEPDALKSSLLTLFASLPRS